MNLVFAQSGLVVDCNFDECGVGSIVQLIQNLINIMITFGIYLATFAIVTAGVYYVFSSTVPERRNHAKKILKQTFIGFLIMLSAFLIVKALFSLLGFGAPDSLFDPGESTTVYTSGLV